MTDQTNQEPQNQTPPSTGSNTAKKLGLLGLILLFILGASACALRRPTGVLDLESTVPPAEEESKPPETQIPGIGVSRGTFIDYYDWVEFQEADPVNGMENFIGVWDTSYMQFLGKDSELYQASINGFVDGEASNHGSLTLEAVNEFAGLIDPASTEWVANGFNSVLANDCQDHSSTTRFGTNEFQITCNQVQTRNLFSLTIFDSRMGRL